MARVLGPFHSEKARGSIGAITASTWKGGPVMRRIPIPARRMRTSQPFNRSLLGFLSREYGTLSDGDRDLWEQYALDHPQDDGFGGTFIMSGQNAYIMLNHTAVRLGGVVALQTAPPADAAPASVFSLTVVTGAGNAGEIDVDWTHIGAPDAADKNTIRMAGPFQSAARQEVHSRFHYVAQTAGDVITYTLMGLVEGTWYWVKVRYVDQYGQTTAWLIGQATPKTSI